MAIRPLPMQIPEKLMETLDIVFFKAYALA